MTTEYQPTEDPTQEPGDLNPADRDWAALRESRDQWRQKAEAMEDAAIDGVLLKSGFDPESGEGRALRKAIRDGEVEPDPGAVAAHAGDAYGWKPSVALYSTTEMTQIAGHERLDALYQDSYSEQEPVDRTAAAMQDARERGDFHTASALERKAARRRGP